MASTQTTTRRLGDTDLFPVGLGAMPMSLSGRPEEERSVRTIQAALDAGCRLIDTADAYAKDESEVGHNERLIAKALRGRRDDVIVATKGGHIRPGGAWEIDASRQHLREACEASLRALQTDRIDLYQLHRPDSSVPYAESVGALKELQDEGKVRWVGLSNANAEQLEEALAIVDVVSLQNQLSLAYTGPLDKGEVQLATDRDVTFLPWSPLGGIGSADSAGTLAPVAEAAERHGVSPQRVALAWLLSLSPRVIPIPGASRPETITDSLQAATLALDADELDAITAAVT